MTFLSVDDTMFIGGNIRMKEIQMPAIQETIAYAVNILGEEVLRDSKKLINSLEDLNPALMEKLSFLRKVYTDEVGDHLYRSYKKSEKDKKKGVEELSDFLSNEYGYKQEWIQQFIDDFSFIYGATIEIKDSEPFKTEALSKTTDTVDFFTKNNNEFNNPTDNKESLEYNEINNKSIVEGTRELAISSQNPKAQFQMGEIFCFGFFDVQQDYAEALKWYMMAAQQNHVKAMYRLGSMYLDGLGVNVDYTQALMWLEKAANNGLADAQCKMGNLYYSGKGVEVNYIKAAEWFQKARNGENAEAIYYLATMYFRGLGFDKNISKAIDLFNEAGEKRVTYAYLYLGDSYLWGNGIGQDYDKAFECYQKGIEKGDLKFYSRIGDMYKNGTGVPKDYSKALECYEKSLSYTKSYGDMYFEGLGTAQNYSKALYIYKMSVADNKKSKTCLKIGEMYEKGLGVPEDYSTALEWYKKYLLEEDFSSFLFDTGTQFERGERYKRNLELAISFYKKAAELKSPDSISLLSEIYERNLSTQEELVLYKKAFESAIRMDMLKIGEKYEKGLGVQEDYSSALKWYKKYLIDENNSSSLLVVGSKFEKGDKYKRNIELANSFYEKAAELGSPEAKKKLQLS